MIRFRATFEFRQNFVGSYLGLDRCFSDVYRILSGYCQFWAGFQWFKNCQQATVGLALLGLGVSSALLGLAEKEMNGLSARHTK